MCSPHLFITHLQTGKTGLLQLLHKEMSALPEVFRSVTFLTMADQREGCSVFDMLKDRIGPSQLKEVWSPPTSEGGFPPKTEGK